MMISEEDHVSGHMFLKVRIGEHRLTHQICSVFCTDDHGRVDLEWLLTEIVYFVGFGAGPISIHCPELSVGVGIQPWPPLTTCGSSSGRLQRRAQSSTGLRRAAALPCQPEKSSMWGG